MTPASCAGCEYMRLRYVLAWAEHRQRCFRPQTYKDGTQVPLSDLGTDCAFENDNEPEDQRMAGDKCGPSRRHFKAGSVM